MGDGKNTIDPADGHDAYLKLSPKQSLAWMGKLHVIPLEGPMGLLTTGRKLVCHCRVMKTSPNIVC